MTVSNKLRTFLATTALDEFWDKTQPILFLGEWCKPYETQNIWKNLDYDTLHSPLIDQDPDAVCGYIYEVYKEILPKISEWLNEIHGTTYAVRYWEIIIGTFLFTHIQIVYDRYCRLKKAYSLYPELTTIGLAKASFLIPLNTDEYYRLGIHNDAMNLQIITQIISLVFNCAAINKDYSWTEEKKQREDETLKKFFYRFATRSKLYLTWFFLKLRGSKTVAVMIVNFSKKEWYRLMWSSRFRVFPLAPRSCALKESSELLQTAPNFLLRSGILNLSSTNEFSKLVLQLLVANMPMSFIENYKKERAISKKRYPYLVKGILSISSSDESVNLWVAKNSNKNVVRIGLQHGGGFGALKSLSSEFWDHTYYDFYISWGMKNKNNVIAAPVASICRLIKEKKGKKRLLYKSNEILWITTEFPKYPPEVKQAVGANHDESLYFNRQSKLLTLLHPNIFSKVTMRLRHTSWSNRWKYIQDEFPNLKFYKPTDKLSFYNHILTANLLLFDNLNTTYLYGLAMNIPCILFWSEEIWTITEDVKLYFDALHDVGIYHTTIESAANMINKIGEDPFLWWGREEVQLARQKFCDYFATVSDDWLIQWKDILLDRLQHA